MKRIMSFLLVFSMLLTCIPMISAAEVQPADLPNEGVSLFGFSDYKLSNGNSPMAKPRAFIGFNSAEPDVMQTMFTMTDKISTAAEVVDGVIYAYAHNYTYDIGNPTAEIFYRIDVNDTVWTSTQLGNFGTDYEYNVLDMTYAADTDTLYAMAIQDSTGDHLIMEVDRNDGSLTELVDLADIEVACVPAFAYIGNGEFFTTSHTESTGLIINLEGIVRELETTCNSGYEALNEVTYYEPHNVLYGVKLRNFAAGNFAILISIDPVTGEATELGAIGGGHGYSLTSLFAIPNVDIIGPDLPTQEEFDAAINAEGSSLTFINGNAYPWQIVTQSGRTFVQSTNNGASNSSSSVTAVFNGLVAGQVLSFDWTVSSENNYDWLNFYSNGTRIRRISGSTSWSTYSYTIPSDGDYTFEWTYSKDTSVNNGNDCGSIDNVSLTGNQPEPYDPSLMEGLLNEALNAEGSTIEFFNDLINPWTIDDSESGRLSAKSTLTTANMHQTIHMFLNDVQAGDAIRFEWKADTGEYNRLKFRQNLAIVDSIGNNNTWEEVIFIIPADGSYAYTWDFTIHTDGVDPSEGCTVWVDNVEYIRDYEPENPELPEMPNEDDFNAAVNADGEMREFENDTVRPWQIVQDDDRTCVVSDIAGLEDTYTEFTIDIGYLEAGSTITFDWKTSSEVGYDCVSLTLNGYAYVSESGQKGWTTVTFTVFTSGNYVLGWRYEKNNNTNSFSDCVWVDNIIITPHSADLMGDVNGDGVVNMQDALAVLRHVIGSAIIPEQYQPYADMDGNGSIQLPDALSILRMVIGNPNLMS